MLDRRIALRSTVSLWLLSMFALEFPALEFPPPDHTISFAGPAGAPPDRAVWRPEVMRQLFCPPRGLRRVAGRFKNTSRKQNKGGAPKRPARLIRPPSSALPHAGAPDAVPDMV